MDNFYLSALLKEIRPKILDQTIPIANDYLKADLEKVQIIPVVCVYDVVKEALDWKGNEKILKKLKQMKK